MLDGWEILRSYKHFPLPLSLLSVLAQKWDGDDMGGVSKIGMVKEGLIK
jgi:hypothetical protein